MREINCLGCGKTHERTTNIRHMPNPETGVHGWHCDKWFKVAKKFEFTTDKVKESRRQYKKELYQPYRAGSFSREFKEANPEVSKNMVKEGAITQRQYDKAKNVWSDEDVL